MLRPLQMTTEFACMSTTMAFFCIYQYHTSGVVRLQFLCSERGPSTLLQIGRKFVFMYLLGNLYVLILFIYCQLVGLVN